MNIWDKPIFRNAVVNSVKFINGVLVVKFSYAEPKNRLTDIIYPCDILPMVFSCEPTDELNYYQLFDVTHIEGAIGKYIRVESDRFNAYSIHHIVNDFGIIGSVPRPSKENA